VAICAAPVVLPHFDLANLPPICLPTSLLRAGVPVCGAAAPSRDQLACDLGHRRLFLLAACFYHTNIIAETASSAWPQRRDVTLDKFLYNLPQLTLGVLELVAAGAAPGPPPPGS
jgi:hypothetical protein